jgi:hypothetical protein
MGPGGMILRGIAQAAVSLAPLGVLLLFWGVFPRDRGIHPIYRESRIETTDQRAEVEAHRNYGPLAVHELFPRGIQTFL